MKAAPFQPQISVMSSVAASHFIFIFMMHLSATGTFALFLLLQECQHSGDRAQAFCFKIKREIFNIKALNRGKLLAIQMDN